MEKCSVQLLVIVSLMSIHLCHSITISDGNNDDTSIDLQLQTDIKPPHQSTSSELSSPVSQISEESQIIQDAKDGLLRSILKNAVIEVSRYLRVIEAATKHDTSLPTTDEAFHYVTNNPSESRLLGNGDLEQAGAGLEDLVKRSTTPMAPLRKRQLNALERAVIRQEILRRLEEGKNPVEIPIGLRFRRVYGDDALNGHRSFVDSFFPTSYRLGYGPLSQGSRHSSWALF